MVAVSRPYLDEARRRGARAPVQSVVANGVDLARFGPGENLRQRLGLGTHRVLGALGRLSRQKGHDILLRAFAELRPLYPETALLVGGDGEMRRQLEEQAGALGLGDAVRWMGEVADTPEFLRTLDVAHNHLAELPAELAGLGELTHLRLEHNELTALPPAFGNLAKLESVHLESA